MRGFQRFPDELQAKVGGSVVKTERFDSDREILPRKHRNAGGEETKSRYFRCNR